MSRTQIAFMAAGLLLTIFVLLIQGMKFKALGYTMSLRAYLLVVWIIVVPILLVVGLD